MVPVSELKKRAVCYAYLLSVLFYAVYLLFFYVCFDFSYYLFLGVLAQFIFFDGCIAPFFAYLFVSILRLFKFDKHLNQRDIVALSACLGAYVGLLVFVNTYPGLDVPHVVGIRSEFDIPYFVIASPTMRTWLTTY